MYGLHYFPEKLVAALSEVTAGTYPGFRVGARMLGRMESQFGTDGESVWDGWRVSLGRMESQFGTDGESDCDFFHFCEIKIRLLVDA